MTTRQEIHLGQMHVRGVSAPIERIRTESWVGVLDKSFTPVFVGMCLGQRLWEDGFKFSGLRGQWNFSELPKGGQFRRHEGSIHGVRARAEVMRWFRSDHGAQIRSTASRLHPRDPVFRVTVKRARGVTRADVLGALWNSSAWVCCLGTREDPWESVCCLLMPEDAAIGPLFSEPPRYYMKIIQRDGKPVSQGMQRLLRPLPKTTLWDRFQRNQARGLRRGACSQSSGISGINSEG